MSQAKVTAYEGRVLEDGTHQVVRLHADGDASALDPRLDIRNKSPSGFAWGYGGSGPGQLALAILADHLRDDSLAEDLHQPFKEQVVAQLDQRVGWRLTPAEVDAVVAELRAAG